MLDALELGECLTSDTFSSLQEAISLFETNMRTRAAAASQELLDNGAPMHSDDALNAMLDMFRGTNTWRNMITCYNFLLNKKVALYTGHFCFIILF